MDAIELLGQMLSINAKSFNADLVDIAWQWEQTMAANDKGSPQQAMSAILGLTRVYLRGRGYNLGNWTVYRAHSLKYALMSTSVIMKVEEKGEILFPTLHRLGFGSVEKSCSTMKGMVSSYDIIEEVERILREKR